MTTAVLLGASFETGNMGVNALTDGAIRCILGAFPNARITILDYGILPRCYTLRCGDRDVTVSAEMLRFSKILWSRGHIVRLIAAAIGVRALRRSTLARRIILANSPLSILTDATIVCAVSGGDSFSDMYGLKRFAYVVLPMVLAAILKVNLVLLPQTYGPYRRTLARFLAAYVIRRSSKVFLRDLTGETTVRRLADNGLPRPVHAYDVAFAVPPHRPAEESDAVDTMRFGGRPVVGMTVSGLLYMGGYTGKNMFSLAAPYPHLVNRLVKHLLDDRGAAVILIPHVFGPGIPENDSDASRLVLEQVAPRGHERLAMIQGQHTHNEIKFLIGRCDFFAGSRMHACIAALSQAVPTVGLAYSGKFAGVFGRVGAADLVVDLTTASEDLALAAVDRAFDMREQIARRLGRCAARAEVFLTTMLLDPVSLPPAPDPEQT